MPFLHQIKSMLRNISQLLLILRIHARRRQQVRFGLKNEDGQSLKINLYFLYSILENICNSLVTQEARCKCSFLHKNYKVERFISQKTHKM